MNNNRVIKILFVTVSLLFSCSKTNNEQPDESKEEADTSIYVDVKGDSFYLDKEYDLKFKYNDSFFNENAKTFNKDLALLTLGHAFTSDKKTTATEFVNAIGFTDVDNSTYDIGVLTKNGYVAFGGYCYSYPYYN